MLLRLMVLMMVHGRGGGIAYVARSLVVYELDVVEGSGRLASSGTGRLAVTRQSAREVEMARAETAMTTASVRGVRGGLLISLWRVAGCWCGGSVEQLLELVRYGHAHFLDVVHLVGVGVRVRVHVVVHFLVECELKFCSLAKCSICNLEWNESD